MQVTSNGKVRRSEAEWREILAQWKQSGLSRNVFCKRAGIAKASFDKWKQRLSMSADPSPRSFVELSVPLDDSAGSAALGDGEFEMVFPGDVVLRWKR